MAITTIQHYINECRVLLQDTTPAPRYSDKEFQSALGMAFDEAYRIRPDMFIDTPQQFINIAPLDYVVPVPRGYHMAFVYYMCGYVQLRDAEDTVDARAGVFMNKFVAQLLTTAA